MSETVVSQKVERVCEGCQKKVVFEMVTPTDDEVTAMMDWFVVGRKVINPENGRPVQIMGHACSLACITAVGLKMAEVPSNPADDIDLSALRAGDTIQ